MIGWLLGTRVGRGLSALVAAVALIGAAWVAGARDARQRATTEAIKGQNETLQEVRDHERETSQMDDTSLADIITRHD